MTINFTKVFFFYLWILLSLSACNSDHATRNNFNGQKNIPGSIQSEKDYTSDLFDGSLRWKNSKNIVERLFEEALEKDKTMKDLNRQINGLHASQADSLEAYNFYAQSNDTYWAVANRYASSISDTILRNEMYALFKRMESNYREKTVPYQEQKMQIDLKSKALDNQLYALKLMTSLKLITQYQENGLPAIEQLENLNNRYDQLIKKSQAVLKDLK